MLTDRPIIAVHDRGSFAALKRHRAVLNLFDQYEAWLFRISARYIQKHHLVLLACIENARQPHPVWPAAKQAGSFMPSTPSGERLSFLDDSP